MNIISIILFLLLISSGSVFAASYFDKRYEEVLPITCAGIIAIAFLFGLVDILRFSTIFISIACSLLFVFGIIHAIKKSKNIIKKIFTPAFFVFIALLGFMFLGVHNKVINSVDEYSHWGDIVKVMTLKDMLGTNINAHAMYPSYPPAMSLFQYVLEEINCFVSKESFSEWLAYFGYDILAISFILPVCSKFNKNKAFSYITYVILIITLPFAFYLYSYFSLYIDSFLSFLIAAGLIELLWHDNEDIWFDLRMCSIMFTLTLSKDTGLLFAALLFVGYVFEHICKSDNKLSKNNIISILFGAGSIAISKLLWSLSIMLGGVNRIFSNKIDLKNLFLVLIGKDDSYRSTVLKNYVTELVTSGRDIGNTNVMINYALLVVFAIAGSYLVIYLINKKQLVNKINCSITTYISISIIVIFVIGMCIIYMYKFSEEEALGLASLDRYLNIVYFGEWLFITLSLLIYANNYDINEKVICILLICFSLTCTSLETIVTFVSNAFAKASLAIREIYTPITDSVLEHLDGNDKVWFIKQYSDNEDGLVFNYLIRPNYSDGSWSLGIPYDEDDDFTVNLKPEEWKEQLINNNYDYVYLYDVDGQFREYYASCFVDANNINDETLYSVNKQTGMLSLCE